MVLRSSSGQSFIELLVGVAVGAIFTIGAATIIVPALQINRQAGNVQAEAQMGQELSNNVKAWAAGNWANVLTAATGSSNTYWLNTSSSPFTLVSTSTNIVWAYDRAITVTSTTSVASGTNANFPFLVSSTVSDWATSGHGGVIQNLVTAPNGGIEPADLVFSASPSNCRTGGYLNFEVESYNSSTGALVAWVNVPSLSAGTVIYACYDSAAATTDRSNPAGTWNSGYAGVWHLNESGAPYRDSTGYGNNSTAGPYPTATQGSISGGQLFDGASTAIYANGVSSYIQTGDVTFSAWIKLTSSYATSSSPQDIMWDGEGASGNDFQLGLGSGSPMPNAPGALGAGHDTGGNNWYAAVSNKNSWAAGTWYYVGGTFSGTNGSIAYVNGVASGTDSNTVRGTPYATQFSIGSGMGLGGGGQFGGVIDEVHVSNVARSPSWFLTEYNNQSTPSKFYAVGGATSLGAATSTSVNRELITLNGTAYYRDFYLADVYRDGNGAVTSTASGNYYDPSTKLATVVVGQVSSTATLTFPFYIARTGNQAFSQTSWSGGSGQSSAVTVASSTYSSATNIAVNASGSIQLSAGSSNSCNVAWAFVQDVSGSGGVALPANTVAGDTLLVQAVWSQGSTASISDTQGNTFNQIGSDQFGSFSGGIYSRLYYASNIKGGADTVTVTVSGSPVSNYFVVDEYSGVGALDTFAVATGSGASTFSSGNITTAGSNELLYGVEVDSQDGAPDPSWAYRDSANGDSVADRLAVTPGTYSYTGSTMNAYIAWIVAFQP